MTVDDLLGQTVVVIGGSAADVAALAVHLMTALTGATYDIDGGRQLVPG